MERYAVVCEGNFPGLPGFVPVDKGKEFVGVVKKSSDEKDFVEHFSTHSGITESYQKQLP